MQKTKILIILFVLLSIINGYQKIQPDYCYENCHNKTECAKDDVCATQLEICNDLCAQFQNPFHEYACIKDCIDHQFGQKISPKSSSFLQCQQDCLDGKTQINVTEKKINPPETKKIEQKQKSKIEKEQVIVDEEEDNHEDQKKQQNQQILQNKYKEIDALRKQIQKDPLSHPGHTLQKIDCERAPKKLVYVLRGNTHKMILNYFQSRCDIDIIPPTSKSPNHFYFKWADYQYQIDYEAFREGHQIVNHLPNLRPLISDKDGIYKTLVEFDKKKLYDFDSTSFHFQTYLFDLDSQTLNDQERYFFENVQDGYWLAKDPDGSLGLGIQLFRGASEIKKTIKNIKAKQGVNKKQRELAKFSVIQQYLHNPLLLDGKKFDLRVYVLIASVDPFVVLFQQGFVRKCVSNYDLDFKQFDSSEAFKHLTNRVYQAKHPDYEDHQEELLIKPKDYAKMLTLEYGLNQKEIDALIVKGAKTVAYSIAAARDKFIKKKGFFQLMGVDLIYDDELKPYLIEFNTSAGLYTILKAHLNVVPQLVQSTLDLILKTHEDMDNLWKVWEHPEDLDLGRWQILFNEATGYDILASHKRSKNGKKEDL